MTVQEIEVTITKLPINRLIELSTWLDECQARVWDQQIETDVAVDTSLAEEVAQWEAASDEDWLKFENKLAETM